MSSGSVLAVIDFVPGLGSANGFAPRAYHLLKAVAEHWPLDVFALDRSDPQWDEPLPFTAAIPTNDFWREPVGSNPLYAPGFKGKMRRSTHYLLGKRSSMAYPDRLPRLEEYMVARPPKLAIFFLPYVAHLSFALPASIPRIYVLEEGLERSFSWVAPPMPDWKRERMDSTEQAHARRLYQKVAQSKGHVVAISEEEKQWFSQYIPESRITVIPHGIDCDYFRPSEPSPDQDIDIAVFGGLGQRRTYEPALELYQIASQRSPMSHLRWAFVGSQPHKSLKALQSAQVDVTGFVPDVRPYYSRSKVVIVPSQHGGGVKTTVLQAWAMGRPVVATPFALTSLPASSGENVLVGESSSDLADQCSRLISSPELRSAIGGAGRKTVCTQRDVRVVASQFVQLCAKALRDTD